MNKDSKIISLNPLNKIALLKNIHYKVSLKLRNPKFSNYFKI